MNRVLYPLVILAFAHALFACSGHAVKPSRGESTVVSAAHSIYLEGGVLKVLSDDDQNILFVYVRPEVLDHWVASGGGGGNQDNPWHFKSAIVWTPEEERMQYGKSSDTKAFDFMFNSQDMTLTVDNGTYAVRRGDFIVIALDKDMNPVAVSSGIESLRSFDLPENEKQHLLSEARKHYTDL